MKKKLNKLFCFLLCILLISLSVCPVSATDYSYTNYSDLMSQFNIVMSNTISSPTRFAGLTSDIQTKINDIISNFNIDINDIYLISFSSVSTNLIKPSGNLTIDYYTSGQNSYTCVKNCFIYSYNNNTQTYNSQSITSYFGTGASAYLYLYPHKTVYWLTTSNTLTYNIDDVSYNPSPDPSPNTDYEYIEMDLPPTPYGYLWTQSMLLRWDELASKWPNEFTNMQRGEWPFDNNEQAELFASLYNLGIIFETYASSNYKFYDNVSYNLATFMNSFDDISDGLNKLVEIYASDQEVEAREAAADNQQAVVDNFLDSQGDGSVSASNLGELADSSAEIKSNFDTGYSASGVWDVFDRNWDWFSNTTKNNLEPPAQNVRSVEEYDTPFLDNAINEILRLRGN